jgi:hypothetical protein
MKWPRLRWPAIAAPRADEPLAPLWTRLLWMASCCGSEGIGLAAATLSDD